MFLHSTRSHFKSVFSPFFSLGISILLNPPLGNSFLLEKASFPLLSRASILGAEGCDPNILGRGSCVSRMEGLRGVVGVMDPWVMGHGHGHGPREILLYLIMYMKYTYVRKWLLLKRNCIILPEVALNG